MGDAAVDAHAGHRRSGRLLSGVLGLDNSLQVQAVTKIFKIINSNIADYFYIIIY